MIEDTLNLISNPDMNFKKPLKVLIGLFRLNSLERMESIKEE
jgi:hypothetical protein